MACRLVLIGSNRKEAGGRGGGGGGERKLWEKVRGGGRMGFLRFPACQAYIYTQFFNN